MKPLDDRIAVQPLDAPDKIGRIIIPEKAKKPVYRGRVVAIGPGVFDSKSETHKPIDTIKVGDIVVYPQYAELTYEYNHESGRKAKHAFLNYSDILAVIEE